MIPKRDVATAVPCSHSFSAGW